MTTNKQPWRPTTFIRHLESFPTATCTAHILTDQGEGYIKALGNRGGPHLLACELVATQLAARLGLPVFDFAIMEVTDDDEIPFAKSGKAQCGPAYITRKEEGLTWGGSAEELEIVENSQDISRLVIFDTWTLNCDRYPPDPETRKPNHNNVFLSREGAQPDKLIIKAMDHTHCFTCGDPLRKTARIDNVKDERLYGMFPGFMPYLNPLEARQAISDLSAIKRSEISAIVGTIPNEWEVEHEAREALVELIYFRAAYLRDYIDSIIESIESRIKPALNAD